MNIGLDFDGVITQWGAFKSVCGKKLHGIDIHPDQFSRSTLVGNGHMTEEDYTKFKQDILCSWEHGQYMEPVSGVFEHVEQLKRGGHSIRIVTSRSDISLNVAEQWAQKHGLALEFTGVGEGKSKAEACTGLDVFIDDDFHKLELLADVVPHLFLFSWGYNAHRDTGTVAQRIHSWKEFGTEINQLEKLINNEVSLY